MIKHFSQLPIEKFNYAKMIQDCIDLITKYGLCLPTGIFMLAKALATIQKVAERHEILYKLKQGEIKYELQITDVPEFRQMLQNGASRLAYAILLVGLFIGAIGILDKRPDLKYGYFLLFVSSFLIFIVMLKWIFRKKGIRRERLEIRD